MVWWDWWSGEDRRCAVFRFFAAVTSLVAVKILERYLPHMLSPLYRATTDGQCKHSHYSACALFVALLIDRIMNWMFIETAAETAESHNNASELAKEVLEVIESKVGTPAFLGAFTKVQKAISDKREQRKRERAMEAIVEPAKAAKRRMEKNAAKKNQGSKKRKADSYMVMKGKKKSRKGGSV